MFSVNIDKLVSMTPAESESYLDTAETILSLCEEQCRTIAVEGDALGAFKLAYAISQKGRKVLFVDADAGNEYFLSKYRLGKDLKGFTDYLVKPETDVKDLVCLTNKDEVNVMFTGDITQVGNVAGYGGRIVFMMAEVLDIYDFVVVLTADGRGAACCGGTVIIMKRSEYSDEAADELTDRLTKAGCNVLGVIIGE